MSDSQEQKVFETQVNTQIPLEADAFEKVTEELEQLVPYSPFVVLI